MLFLRKQYFAAIRDGSKTTTIRFWRYAMVRPGSVEVVRGLGRLKIEAVEEIALESLTAADARADGFADLGSLHTALTAHYPPEAREGKQLYRVRFVFVG
ncbi:MAG: ASCH domain-containing protein [Planctomycetota bacterium]|nr:ASCH domain-containing protein [Planctomycetota bacterium]